MHPQRTSCRMRWRCACSYVPHISRTIRSAMLPMIILLAASKVRGFEWHKHLHACCRTSNFVIVHNGLQSPRIWLHSSTIHDSKDAKSTHSDPSR